MTETGDATKGRTVSLRLPADLAGILKARQLPGQPFSYVLIMALWDSVANETRKEQSDG